MIAHLAVKKEFNPNKKKYCSLSIFSFFCVLRVLLIVHLITRSFIHYWKEI
jgi:hypothetical protein